MTIKRDDDGGKGKKGERKAKLKKETLRDLSPNERAEGVKGGAAMTNTERMSCSCGCV